MSLEERREERRQELAMSLEDGDGDFGLGQQYEYTEPEQLEEDYEYEDDGEWQQETEEPLYQSAEQQPIQPETAEEQHALFNRHVDELEQEYGIQVPLRARRDIVLHQLDHYGGLNARATEAAFYRHVAAAQDQAADARAEAERDLQERRRSRDPIVRRNARREAIIRSMERGEA